MNVYEAPGGEVCSSALAREGGNGNPIISIIVLWV